MGGCATKPKVLTGDEEGMVPAPVPEPAKEEAAASAPVAVEAKEVVVDDNKEGDDKKVDGVGYADSGGNEITKVVEIVEDGKADDQETKPRSLSNLFKTDKGQELIPVDDNAPSETVKEESTEAEKAKEESETKQPEAENSKIFVENTLTADFVDAHEKPDIVKTSEKKTDDTIITSEIKPEDELKCAEIKREIEKPSDEKKIEEPR